MLLVIPCLTFLIDHLAHCFIRRSAWHVEANKVFFELINDFKGTLMVKSLCKCSRTPDMTKHQKPFQLNVTST